MAEKKYFKKDLIQSIIAKFGSVEALAKYLEIERTGLYQKIERQSPKFLKQLEDCGIVLPSSDEPNVIHPKGNFYKLIKSINAGDPALIYREENIEDEVFFEYPVSEHCFCVRVQGDSMQSGNGKSINEGDILLVDMNISVIQGDVVVVSLANGREMVKRYYSSSENVILRSDNAKYPDIIVSENDVLAIFKAVKKLRSENL